METPCSSQIALASSNSANQTSAPGPSSTASIADEPRHSGNRSTSGQEEERGNAGPSHRESEFEGQIEHGSSARPRTLLRRTRTTQQVEKSNTAGDKVRRASGISFDGQEWSTSHEHDRAKEGSLRGQEDPAMGRWPILERQVVDATTPSSRSTVTREAGASPSSPLPPSSTLSVPTSRNSRLDTPPSRSTILNRSLSIATLSVGASNRMSAPLPSPSRRRRANSLPCNSSSPRRGSRSAIPHPRSSSTLACDDQDKTGHARYLPNKGSRKRSVDFDFRASSSGSTRPSGSGARTSSNQIYSQSDLVKIHTTNLVRNGVCVTSTLGPASLSPPISRNTLRELDLHEVMRNAQLRHDVVFDPNLMFRPNFDGERGERKRVAAEQYWTAVSREISHGCRCSTFSNENLLPCICLQTPSSTQGSCFTVSPNRLPSRIVPLVAELRGILLSLLPATMPPSPTPPATAVFGAALPPSSAPIAASLPVYGPREQLIDALDPILVSRQLLQGSLDVVGLARFLGSTLKTHCAPMRDELVDEMVAVSEGGDGIVTGLRMCFEILELMKLDIANHQLRSLRPYLLQTSVEFERRFFDGVSALSGQKSTAPRSQAWIKNAVESLNEKKRASSANPKTLVDEVVAHGVVELVFSPHSPSSSPQLSQPVSALPETLQLDAFRLAHFHCDATDLTIVYMLTLLYQQLSFPTVPTPGEVDVLRNELWCLISANTGSFPSLVDSPATVVGIPSGPAGQGLEKLEDESWRAAMQDAIFQVAARAQQVKLRSSTHGGTYTPSSAPLAAPDRQLVSLVQGYFDANARSDSKVFQLLSKRLRSTIGLYVEEELAKEKTSGDYEYVRWWTPTAKGVSMRTGSRRAVIPGGSALESSFAPVLNMMATTRGTKRARSEEEGCGHSAGEDATEKRRKLDSSSSISIHRGPASSVSASRFDEALSRNGLSSLANEIKVLGDRITKVTSFNLSVFRPLYESLLSHQRK